MPVRAAPDIAGKAPVNLDAANEVTSASTIVPSTIFAAVTEFAARVSASTDPSGKPPAEIPVTVPLPLITIDISLSYYYPF